MNGGFIVLGRSTFTLSHKNLDAGDTWTYRAFSASDQGTSTVASNVLAVTTPAATKPGTPTDLRIVPVENAGGEALYWNWPASDGGADIANFIVEESLAKSKIWTPRFPAIRAGADGAGTTVAGLVAPQDIIADAVDGTRYRVRASNLADGMDTSRWSLPSNPVTVVDGRRIAEVPVEGTVIPRTSGVLVCRP